jgi:hypothetical protein
MDLDQYKQQQNLRRAQGQADQSQAIQQMKATQRSNLEPTDFEIQQAAGEAKTKNPQNLSDKLAIKLATAKGMQFEFHSKFLSRMI